MRLIFQLGPRAVAAAKESGKPIARRLKISEGGRGSGLRADGSLPADSCESPWSVSVTDGASPVRRDNSHCLLRHTDGAKLESWLPGPFSCDAQGFVDRGGCDVDGAEKQPEVHFGERKPEASTSTPNRCPFQQRHPMFTEFIIYMYPLRVYVVVSGSFDSDRPFLTRLA